MTEEMLFGANAVTEALRARRRRIHEIHLVSGRSSERLESIRELASCAKVGVFDEPPGFFRDRFPDREDQGVAARVGPYPYADLDGLLTVRPALLVALDQVQDPRNLGAIARSAVAFGATGMVIHKDRCATVTPACVKASAGMTEHIRIALVVNLARALAQARDAGLVALGLDGASRRSIFDEDLAADTIIVVGSEKSGLRRLTREGCDALVGIPMAKACESLNVSVAAAVVLAEAARQRR